MERIEAAPFHKAIGGKTGMLWRLEALAPKTIATYHECFVGGGALFWRLASQGRFKRAVLTDANLDLIRTWLAVQKNYVGVLRELSRHRHSKAHYLKVRALDSSKMTDEACAARFLVLTKLGFNGLWRVNKSGAHNVPYGATAKMIQFSDPAKLKACAAALSSKPVTIVHGDFEETTRRVRLGDFVYADPVYHPLSKTSSFRAYTSGGFDENDQRRLAEWFRKLDARGVTALLSNSRCDFIERLYSGMTIESVMARRSINSVPTKRGEIKEVLVLTSALAAQQALR